MVDTMETSFYHRGNKYHVFIKILFQIALYLNLEKTVEIWKQARAI